MKTYKELMEESKKKGTIKGVTPVYKDSFTKNEVIVGKLIRKTPVNSAFGEGTYNQYVLETDEGLIKFMLGQSADREFGDTLEEGQIYALTFLGKEKISGGRTVNKYDCSQLFAGDTESQPNEKGE